MLVYKYKNFKLPSHPSIIKTKQREMNQNFLLNGQKRVRSPRCRRGENVFLGYR